MNDFRLGLTVDRMLALDMLPVIVPSYVKLYVKPIEEEEISWTVYFNPISINAWLMLIFMALLLSIALSGIEKAKEIHYKSYIFNDIVINFLSHFWVTFKSNFGGKPAMIHVKLESELCLMPKK